MKLSITKSPSGSFWSLYANGLFISNYYTKRDATEAGHQLVRDGLTFAR